MAIDVHKSVTAPVTKAINAIDVKRIAMAAFKYQVDDVQSVATMVTIKITKGAKTVKTYNLGSRAANKVLTYKAKTVLPKGSYTWTVYAKDAAGNTQASPAGSNNFTVK